MPDGPGPDPRGVGALTIRLQDAGRLTSSVDRKHTFLHLPNHLYHHRWTPDVLAAALVYVAAVEAADAAVAFRPHGPVPPPVED